MRKTKQKPFKKNYAIPGEPMTETEFKSFVQEAEEGSFYPVEDLKKKVLLAWGKKYGKY
jgi:hypothetical protein